MNLNNVLISQSMILEHLCISAIDCQGYSCLYKKKSDCFDAKKSLNAVSISLERNVFGVKNVSRFLNNGSWWVRNQENMVNVSKSHISSQ